MTAPGGSTSVSRAVSRSSADKAGTPPHLVVTLSFLRQAGVCRERKELDEVVVKGDLLEQLGRLGVEVGVVAGLLGDLGELLLDDPLDELAGHPLAGVGEVYVVVDPLPDLRPADLGGGRVLHQVVDGGRALP